MLGLLMKYEIKAVGRLMLPLYGAWIVMSVLLGLTVSLPEKMFLLSVIVSLLYTVVTVGVGLLSLIMIIQRFYKNLLGAEGYLMFTLPVSAAKHIWNKVISAVIWMIMGVAMGMFSLWIVTLFTPEYGSYVGFIAAFKYSFNTFGGSSTLVSIEMIVLVLLLMAETALKIYAAIAVGHQCSNHRVLGAIGAYLGFGIIEIIFTFIFMKLFENQEIVSMLNSFTRDLTDIGATHTALLLLMALSLILGTVYYIVTYKLLNKRLNLE